MHFPRLERPAFVYIIGIRHCPLFTLGTLLAVVSSRASGFSWAFDTFTVLIGFIRRSSLDHDSPPSQTYAAAWHMGTWRHTWNSPRFDICFILIATGQLQNQYWSSLQSWHANRNQFSGGLGADWNNNATHRKRSTRGILIICSYCHFGQVTQTPRLAARSVGRLAIG